MDKEIKKVENQIWNSLDHLRNMGLQSDSYDIFLFLLVLKRKNLVPKFSLKPTEKLFIDIELAVKEYDNSDLELCYNERYKPLLQDLGEHTCNMIFSQIYSVDLNSQNLNFQEVFDNLLYNFTNAKGRQGGETLLPRGLAHFMTNQVNLSSGSRVYNPFAGYGSFGILLKNDISYIGQEILTGTWALGVLRRVVYNKITDSFVQDDSIKNWIDNENIDLVISAPPFGRINSLSNNKDIYYRDFIEFVISKGLEVLNPKGKMVILVPNGFLFNHGSTIKLRKHLIEKDLIERIISLPTGILHNTNVNTSILVLNKNKAEKEIITLIDATKYSINKIKEVSIDYIDLLEKISMESGAEGFKKINRNEIDANEYSLDIGRYFWQEELESATNENLIELSEILEDVKGERIFDDPLQKEISIKHLSKDNLNYTINLNDIEIKEGKIRNALLISESCLLVAKIGNDLKPNYFEFQGEKIAVSNNIMAFRIKGLNEKIDLDYIINELYSDFVLRQLSAYRRGIAQQLISKKDFLKLMIPLPDIDSQKQKMLGVKEAYIKSREKEFELQKQLIGYKDEAFREFASIKHTFRQYLNGMASNVSGTFKFIAKNEGKPINLDMLYSKNLNQTLGEHLNKINETIYSLNKLLDVPESNVRESSKLELQNPLGLLKEAQLTFKSPEIFKFSKIYIDEPSFSEIGGVNKSSINIAKDDFYRIFSNIIANAVDHGFKNSKKGNVINIALSANQNNLIIEISNNGKSMPEGFEINRIITRGEKTSDSTGSGIGGSDINQILKSWDAELEVLNNKNDEFPVKYILKFQNYITRFTI